MPARGRIFVHDRIGFAGGTADEINTIVGTETFVPLTELDIGWAKGRDHWLTNDGG